METILTSPGKNNNKIETITTDKLCEHCLLETTLLFSYDNIDYDNVVF